MVVVVGREASDLEKFIWNRSEIGMGEIPGDRVEQILAFDDEEKLRAAARQYLGIPASENAEVASDG